jgi:hypothetical protein
MEGFSFVTPVTVLSTPNTGKEGGDDDKMSVKTRVLVRWTIISVVLYSVMVRLSCSYCFHVPCFVVHPCCCACYCWKFFQSGLSPFYARVQCRSCSVRFSLFGGLLDNVLAAVFIPGSGVVWLLLLLILSR